MNTAAMELGMHHYKSFVIASDHGASRLAVIRKQEVPYETDTKGEHSGRCCKSFDDCDVPGIKVSHTHTHECVILEITHDSVKLRHTI